MELKASNSITKFAIKFCNELGKFKTTVCSPLSAESVLALLALGCRNESRAELLKALDFPDDDVLRSSFGYVISTLRSTRGVTLNFANKVYLKKGGKLKAEIRNDAKEVFKSSLEQLDFNEKEAAAGTINKWVKQKTKNTIKNIVSPEMFNDLTCLVLVNAIYFKGTWKNTFDEAHTRDRIFHVNITTQIKVPQMCIEGECFKYTNSVNLEAQLLQLDYTSDDASMIIVLPNEIEGIFGVMRKLSQGYDLMAEIDTLEETEVDVTIPKFKVKTTIDLKKLLPKMEIKSIFDPKTANINMLTSSEKLFVSQAIQEVFISVDEEGTEAGACTEMDGWVDLCDIDPVRFTADRPFLYLVMVRNVPLFIGIYKGIEYAVKMNTY